MNCAKKDAEKAEARQDMLYHETIFFGKVYHGLMWAVILLLAAGLVVFLVTAVYAGAIACGLLLPFIAWTYVGCRKVDLHVTPERFEVRYWFRKLSVRLADITWVEVQDRLTLPRPQQGHIKVFFGWESCGGLEVMAWRRGTPAVEIRKTDGVTILITPLDANKLAEAIRRGIEQRK